MSLRSLFLWVVLGGLFLTMLGCQDSESLELVWSVRRGLVGQFGARGEEVFTVGRYLGRYGLATGRELRRMHLSQDYGNLTFGEIAPEVVISKSSIVFGWYDFDSEAGQIFSYGQNALTLRWKREFKWQWKVRDTRPTFSVVSDGVHLYALALGKEGQNLFKLRLSDGGTVWSTTIERYVKGIPVLLHDGMLLVHSVVSLDHPNQYGYFQAIKPETGEMIWQTRIDGLLNFDDPPFISGDRAYVTSQAVLSDPDHFYTIDLKRGTVTNRQRVRLLRAPFAKHRDVLYFGGNTPAAFDIVRGILLWQTATLDRKREEIYLGDSERNLYVLSSTTGQIKDKVNIRGYWRGDILFNPVKAFFGSYGVKRLELNQGLLFVGTVDSSLFVFRRTEKK